MSNPIRNPMRRNLSPRYVIFILIPLAGLFTIIEDMTVLNTDAAFKEQRALLRADIEKPTRQIEESSPYVRDDIENPKNNNRLDKSGVITETAAIAKKENETVSEQRLKEEVMELEDDFKATQPQEGGTGTSQLLVDVIQDLKKRLEESNSQMQPSREELTRLTQDQLQKSQSKPKDTSTATSDANSGVINEWYGTEIADSDNTGATQRLIQVEKTLDTGTPASSSATTSLNTSTTAITTTLANATSKREKEPGFAACMLVLDDTLRLYEWLSYHYTVLPLTSLVIGVDPKSSNNSVTEIENIAERWSHFGLNITIWPMGEFKRHRDRQTTFVQRCTHHFKDKKREKWVLLTDSDEFLSYNFIMPGGENITHFDLKNTIFSGSTAPSVEQRAADRYAALPIRESLPDFHRSNATILSFIEAQQANSSQDYFPKKRGCNRIVGLTYGIKTTKDTQDDPLMTRRYQHHKKPSDRFSKVFVELSKVKPGDLNQLGTIHNPFIKLCGKNGKYDSGQDFMGSVLRVNHYVGSLESWLERGGGNGTRVNKQNEETWRKKDSREPDYKGPPDVRAGDWVNSFVTMVGTQTAEELLFRPLAERTAFVRSKIADSDSAGATQRLLPAEKTLGTDTPASSSTTTFLNTSTTAITTTTANASSDREKEPGFAACMLVLDDTLRMYEWLSYHYTVLPLTSLVIGVDPKSSNNSVTEIENIAEQWSHFGLNITIWPMGEFKRHRDRQTTFVQRCTHHFKDKKREKWVLLTDSDEFLSYNFIMPGGENITHFDLENTIFSGSTAPSVEQRAADRYAALPIRESLPDFHRSNATILSFIEAQQANSSQDYFPKKRGCNRIVGLTYGIKTTKDTQDDPLMTRRYQHHKKPSDRFSKVFVELSKVKPGDLNQLGTIHNPFIKLCGKNGKYDSGQDFMGSVLRVNHYVGSLESWLERGGGNGTRVNKQNEETWRKKDSREPDYKGPPDVRAGDWVNSFVTKVGTQTAEELLFRPLAERTAFVRSKLHL